MRVRAISAAGFCIGLMSVPLVCARPAAAQMETREGIALQNQILELQREIQALAQRGGGGGYGGTYPAPATGGYAPGGAGASDLTARLLTRVDSLESAVRELRGQVEQLNNELQQQTAQLGKRIDDLQFQVQNPQNASPPPPRARAAAPSAPAAAPAPLAVPQTTATSPTTAGRRTPELSLQEGDAALARHDYAAAEKDARAVLANRASPRAYDAQLLLAQALMGQRQYSQAAIAYDDAYNRQKKGAHAPVALLGLADSLVAINEKRAACDTLTKLHSEFPNLRADVRDRAAQTGKRAGCR